MGGLFLLLFAVLLTTSYAHPIEGCDGWKVGSPFGNSGIFQVSDYFSYSNSSIVGDSLKTAKVCLVVFNNTVEKSAHRCFVSIESAFYKETISEEAYMELQFDGLEQYYQFAYFQPPFQNITLSAWKSPLKYIPQLAWSNCSLVEEGLQYRGFSNVIKLACYHDTQIGYATNVYARVTRSGGCQPLMTYKYLDVETTTSYSTADFKFFKPLTMDNMLFFEDVFDPYFDLVNSLFF